MMMVMLALGVGLCLFSIGIITGVLIGEHRMRNYHSGRNDDG